MSLSTQNQLNMGLGLINHKKINFIAWQVTLTGKTLCILKIFTKVFDCAMHTVLARKVTNIVWMDKVNFNWIKSDLSISETMNEMVRIKQFSKWHHPHFWSDKGIQSTVVNQACQYFKWQVTWNKSSFK